MIRYNKQLNDKITKTVRNYNAKINRLQKKNPYLALPEKVTATSIKNISDTRKDLNRELAKLKRFSKKGAENTIVLPSGEMVSEYELSELKRESARLKRNLTKRINQLAGTVPKVAGVKQDFTYAEMGDMRLNNMIAKRNELIKLDKQIFKGSSIKEYSNLISKTRNKQKYQIDIFKNNYLDKMLFSQAYLIGYDQEKINTIKEKLSTLSNKDFLKAFDEEKLLQMVRDKYRKSGDVANFWTYQQDLINIYDELYNNIDKIVSDYSSA